MWYSISRFIGSLKLGFIFLLLSILFFPLIATSPTSLNADTLGMQKIVQDIGYLEFVAFGTGTRGDPATNTNVGQGSFSVDITRDMMIVREAHLIWTGRTEKDGQLNIYDDDGVMLSINGNAPVNIMADTQYEQDPWFSVGGNEVVQLHESADITQLIQNLIPQSGTYTGTIDFSIFDQEHGTNAMGKSPDYDLNYGAGVWIVYEYVGGANEPYNEVIMYEGQDSFFRLWTPPRGPHSDVQCVEFSPANFARTAVTTHLVSGVDLLADPGGKRSNAFWYSSGQGVVPTFNSPDPGIINAPDATGYVPTNGDYPLNSSAMLEWDNFEPTGFIQIPANDNWVCFQIESGDSTDLAGLSNAHLAASGMWNFFGIKIETDQVPPPPPPTAVNLISFIAEQENALEVDVSWVTAEEIDNFGYNLYRSPSENFTTAELIHFEPTKVAGGTGPGATYNYIDSVPTSGDWWYWLEDIETGGGNTVHTPISILVTRFIYQYIPLISK